MFLPHWERVTQLLPDGKSFVCLGDISTRREKYTTEAKLHFSGNVFVPDDLEIITL